VILAKVVSSLIEKLAHQVSLVFAKDDRVMIACQTELTCLGCGAVTPHTVVYASLYIKSIVCNQCGFKIEKPVTRLMKQYTHDLPKRASALTLRLKGEATSHPILFALSLPKRMLHKPIELTRELSEVL
jgi:hypothetical protein